MQVFKKTLLATACVAATAGTAQVQAANWLMLQGTEPAGTAARAKVWGFIQPQWQKDYSDPNAGDAYIPPKLIGPDLNSQNSFNVLRARIGARGAALPLDPNVNYFLLLEMGNNAITAPGNAFAKVTDASVTLNHIKGARIRAGLFKYPGAEEGLQAIHVFDYVNFTEVSNQLMLERFPERSFPAGGNVAPQTLPPQTSLNAFTTSVGAFRDTGVQVFDAFDVGNNWELSYAAMIGNGNGLNLSDNDNNKDVYLYFSAEKKFGGKGPFAQGMKFFGWTQRGKRSFDGNNDGTVEEYDRNRSGVGFKYMKKPFRFTAEYMRGEGMIFQGPDKPTFALVPPAVGNPNHPGNGLNAKAKGWYVEGGWYIPHTQFELDARYDQYNRNTNSQFELEFRTWTLGAQYHFNKKTRIAVNYAIRNDEAVNFPTGAGPNQNLDGVGNRLAVQLTTIF